MRPINAKPVSYSLTIALFVAAQATNTANCETKRFYLAKATR
jgi:hypothetical protein